MHIKRNMFIGIMIVFIINILMVFLFVRFFLLDDLEKRFEKENNEAKQTLNEIIPKITNTSIDDIDSLLTTLSNKYHYEFVLKSNELLVFDNTNNNFGLVSEASEIISINGSSYLITITKTTSIFEYTSLVWLFIGELLFMYIIIWIAMLYTNAKVLTPLFRLRNEMRNYRFGQKPKRVKAKTEFDELQNSYVDLVENLELEKEKQNRIIASISHDIKTPLTSIIGYSDLLNKDSLKEEQKDKYIKKINNKALSIKDIVLEFDDYLSCNLARTIKKEEVLVKDLIAKIKEDYKEDLEDKNIILEVRSLALKEKMNIDIYKIKRVFSNIISNSVRHFNLKKGKIIINIISKKDEFEISVSDNATGVKKTDIFKIFDPLYTSDKSRRISGLGLSICKEIIEAHNGEISATNNKLGGLTIIFTIEKEVNK